MLVLSRKLGEKILVGDGISITITQISDSRVSIGIDAPQCVPILRGELHHKLATGNRPRLAEIA